MAWVNLISVDVLRDKGGVFVERDGRELGIFRGESPCEVFVIDNACPHASGNLSGGDVEGTVVTCPWHQWQFDLRTGACVHSPAVRVRRYRAEIRNEHVWADLPSPGDRQPPPGN